MSSQNQKSARSKLSWLEKKMVSSRYRILRRIFHFLHFYIRPLLAALIALFLIGVVFVGARAPLLRSSPKDFRRVIRISVLDWLQARSLARSARASEAKGDFAAAKLAWQLATNNDPGNPEWARGWLANIMHEKPSWKLSSDTTAYIFHFLELSPTNRANFALVANALEHCRIYDNEDPNNLNVLSLFQQLGKDWGSSPEETAPLLRTLFHLGDYKGFRDLWLRTQLQTPGVGWMEDPLMKLYHLGTQALWEKDPNSLGALNEAIAAISPSSPLYAPAQRIALRAAVDAGDLPASRKILEDLRQRQEATLPDTLWFWRLLIAKGMTEEIAQDLENRGDPASERECFFLLKTLADAGLAEETSKTAEKMIDLIGADLPNLWFQYGDWLIRQEKWPLLRELAQQTSISAEIEPVARYWEGLINWQYERYDRAREQFLKIAASPPQLFSIRDKLANRLLNRSLIQRKNVGALYEAIDKAVDALAKGSGKNYPKSRSVALLLAVERGDVPAARKILEDLRRYRQASFADALRFWQLLIAKGTPEEIAQDLEKSGDPVTEQQALNLLQTLLQAGLAEEAEQAAKKSLGQLGDSSVHLWIEYGDMLSREGKFDQLSELSRRIFRTNFRRDEVKKALEPIAFYWEGLVAWQDGRRDQAQERFSKIAASPPQSWEIRSELAWRLIALDQPELAGSLARGLDGRIGNIRKYWMGRVQQAGVAKEWETFFQDAKAAYESDPTFPDHLYSYLVALLQKRENPELALSLSDQLVQWQPNNLLFQLIHTHSLSQNEKYEEAEAILKDISLTEEAAGTPLASDYNMALFKLAAGKGQSEEVLRLYKTLNLENYMPETAQWVEKIISKINQAGGGGGGGEP